MENMKM